MSSSRSELWSWLGLFSVAVEFLTIHIRVRVKKLYLNDQDEAARSVHLCDSA